MSRSLSGGCVYLLISAACQRKRLINYTKIGDAGVPRHGSFNPFNVAVVDSARDARWQIGDTMNKAGPLTMQNVTWRR